MENRIPTSFNILHGFFFSFIVMATGYICVSPLDSFGQKKINTELEEANNYFDSGNWTSAITIFKSYLSRHPDHVSARIQLGKALIKVNRLDDSLEEWKFLIHSKKDFPAEVYFFAGRLSHQLGYFDEADGYYRDYISYQSENFDQDLIAYYLKQIGSAKTAGVAGSQYLIENTGPFVNSASNEFHPVYSPNFDQRFYYSIRDERIGSSFHSASIDNASVMYAEVQHGVWQSQGPMDPSLAGEKEIQLIDFSRDGMQVYYTYPVMDSENTTYVKKYDEAFNQQKISELTHPIYNSVLGDRDLFSINDSAFLFSSNRLEGYGGYDLYVTFKRLGQWVVQNLGTAINGSYDEITPFLCQDGRTLFFSSNCEKSIGGYDIFFANFDDDMETWTNPSNMQSPMNSGMNDVELRMSNDGSSILFSSNRPHGHGGYDVYHAYFNQKWHGQNLINRPRYFYQVQAYRSFANESNVAKAELDKPVYELPVVYFGHRPKVITPVLKTQLDQILRYGKLFPHTGLILNIFTNEAWDTAINLYQPALILKNITDYLQAYGMNPARIKMQLFGNQYPRFTSIKESADLDLEPVKSFNRRLEFDFTDTKNLPVQFGGSSNIQDNGGIVSPYLIWKDRTKDLYFRIQLVESTQLLKGIEMDQEEDLMVTIDNARGLHTYYVGVFHEVAEARKKLSQYNAQGYKKAEIVAFLGPSILAEDKMTPNMIQTYPELKEYIIYQK